MAKPRLDYNYNILRKPFESDTCHCNINEMFNVLCGTAKPFHTVCITHPKNGTYDYCHRCIASLYFSTLASLNFVLAIGNVLLIMNRLHLKPTQLRRECHCVCVCVSFYRFSARFYDVDRFLFSHFLFRFVWHRFRLESCDIESSVFVYFGWKFLEFSISKEMVLCRQCRLGTMGWTSKRCSNIKATESIKIEFISTCSFQL